MNDDDPFGSYGLAQITLSDKSVFDLFFSACPTRLSDYSFANTYIWRLPIHLRWRILHDCLCVFANGEGGLTLLFPPVGKGDIKAAIEQAMDICRQYNNANDLSNVVPRIEYVSQNMLEHFGPQYTAEPMSGDYMYYTQRMIDLQGGDLSSKRQARNRFARRYEARTEPLEDRHVQACLDLLGTWKEQSDEHTGATSIFVKRSKEVSATRDALAHAPNLGLRGMVLFADDKLVGFTLGEQLDSQTCSILIEKCDRDYVGAANYIFSEFCRQFWSHTTWCNVGDDWEIPSLAWTKQSYRPERRLNKYILRPIGWTTSSRTCSQSASGLYISQSIQSAEKTVLPVPAIADPQPQAQAVKPAQEGAAASACDEKLSITEQRTAAWERAAMGDLDGLVMLENSCFTKPIAMSRRQFRYLLKSPSASVHVLRQGGKIVAQALLLRRKTRRGLVGRLYSLAVDSSFRGRGLGRKLLNLCLETLKDEGIHTVYLEVDVDNAAAIALYESAGFTKTRRLGDYYPNGNDGWKMKADLAAEAVMA